MLTNSKWRKLLALMLIFAFSFSLIAMPPSGQGKDVMAENNRIDDQSEASALPAEISLKQRYIVQLNDRELAHQTRLSLVSRNDLSRPQARLEAARFSEDTQAHFMQTLQNEHLPSDIIYQYTLVFNGFSIDLTKAEAEKIKKLPGVKAVGRIEYYNLPTPRSTNTAWSPESLQINQAEAYANGYNGAGMLCAIIDTGADVNHPDFRLSQSTKLKYPDAESVRSKIQQLDISPGAWYSTKIPFAYSYGKKNTQVKPKGAHGMHVAGTVGANGDPTNGGVRGVAPEAQLAILALEDKNGKLAADEMVKAIEDAVKLGCDSINMSLGSTCGYADDVVPSPVGEAITKARNAGIICAIASGNEGNMGFQAYQPNAGDPDYGVLCTPAVENNSFAVASINTPGKKMASLEAEIDGQLQVFPAYLAKNVDNLPFPTELTDMLFCGYGRPEDFPAEISGKIAVIERGAGLPFTNKVKNAKAKGAVAVIIFDNEDGKFIKPEGQIVLPLVMMLKKDGMILKNGTKVRYNGKAIVSYPGAGEMTDFSSWGPTPNLNLKPEITAPGGNVYSTMPNGKYDYMSGTSMATPHICGTSAVVKQRILKDFPNIVERDAHDLVKNLIMSTAITQRDANGLVISPRKQGAGLLDLTAATKANVVVYDADPTHKLSYGISKINLGEVGQNISFTVQFKNYGAKAVRFKAALDVVTDHTEKGKNMLSSQALLQKDLDGEIVVSAGQTLDYPVSFEISAEDHARLLQEMEQGYWLDGFVSFTALDQDHPNLSIPFMGFAGQWNKIRAKEKFIYHMDFSKESPIYQKLSTGEGSALNNMTHLFTLVDGKKVVLGELTKKGDTTRRFAADKLFFSPNGDGKADSVELKAVFTRNFVQNELHVRQHGKDQDLAVLIDNEVNTKNFYNDGYTPWRPDRADHVKGLSWKGLNSEQQALPDGAYDLHYQTLLEIDESVWSEYTTEQVLTVMIDTKAPVIENIQLNGQTLNFTVRDPEPGSGLASSEVILVDGTRLTPNEDGSYTLPAGATAENVVIKAVDAAYNMAGGTITDLLTPGPRGSITIQEETKNGDNPGAKYKIFNANRVEQIGNSNLPYGEYSVELATNLPANIICENKVQKVVIDEKNPNPTVIFKFEKIRYGTIIAIVKSNTDGQIGLVSNADVSVYATDEKGHKFKFQTAYWDPAEHEAYLPFGKYRLTVEYDHKVYTACTPEYRDYVVNSEHEYVLQEFVLTLPKTEAKKLTVKNGIIVDGSSTATEGTYKANSQLSIEADAPAENEVFDTWKINKGNGRFVSETPIARNVFVTGTEDTEIEANFTPFYEGAYWRDQFLTATPLKGWTIVDVDQDGSCWEMEDQGAVTNNGFNSMISSSFSDTSARLTMDDWLISDPIALQDNSTLKVILNGFDTDYSEQNYGIYLSTENIDFANFDPTKFTELEKDSIPYENHYAWKKINLDLSAYNQKTVRIAIRHYNGTANSMALILNSVAVCTANTPPAPPSKYNIAVESGENGSVTPSKTEASEGEQIQFSVKPNDGYEIENVRVEKENGEAVEISPKGSKMPRLATLRQEQTSRLAELLLAAGESNNYSFTMPAANVTIKVTWKAVQVQPNEYTLSVIQSPTGGSVTWTPEKLTAGVTVTLTLQAPQGYAGVSDLQIVDANFNFHQAQKIDENHYSFTMPAANTTVGITWQKADSPTPPPPPTTPGEITVVIEDKTLISEVKVDTVEKNGKAYTVPEGAELKFDITPLSADQAKELKVPETDKAKVEGEGKETLWLDIQTLYKGANDNDFVKINGISANMVVSAAEGKLNTHDVTVYVADDQTMALTECKSTTVGNDIHFFGPHFSYYALVFTAKAEPTPEPQPQPEPPAETQPVVISGPGYHRNPNLTPQVVEPQADKQGNAKNAAANAAADTAKPSQHLPKTGAVDTLPYALLALAAAALLLWKRQ